MESVANLVIDICEYQTVRVMSHFSQSDHLAAYESDVYNLVKIKVKKSKKKGPKKGSKNKVKSSRCPKGTKKSRSGKSLFDLKKEIEKKIRDKDNKKKLYEIYLTTIGLKSQDELNKIKYDFKYAKDNIKFFDSKFVPRIKQINRMSINYI